MAPGRIVYKVKWRQNRVYDGKGRLCFVIPDGVMPDVWTEWCIDLVLRGDGKIRKRRDR